MLGRNHFCCLLGTFFLSGFIATHCCFAQDKLSQSKADQQRQVVAAKKANQIAELLANRDFEAAYEHFGERIKQKLSLEDLEKTWNLQAFVAGALKDVGKPKTASLEPMTFEVPVNYTLYSIITRISVDEKLKVIGLFIRPSSGKGKEPEDLDRKGESEVTLTRDGFTLVGTLRLPELPVQSEESEAAGEQHDSPVPLVILLSGSGPTDRDGNQPMMRNDCLRRLAMRLGEFGIATLRYDKGGSGVAVVSERSLTPGVLVRDLVSWIEIMEQDKRFNNIVLCGHSGGALHALLAGQDSQSVAAVVSLAGAGRNIRDVLQEQLAKQLSESQLASAVEILDELQKGKTVEEVPLVLQSLFRSSVQPYLIDWMKHDPKELVKELSQPVLVVQGEEDIQVTTVDAVRLAESREHVKLVLLPKMNHVLRRIDRAELQTKSYRDATIPIDPACAKEIAEFVLAL